MSRVRVEVPAPLRPPNAIRLSDAILFALVLAIAATARFAWLGADPPRDPGGSEAEVMDAPWYLAPAADLVRGAKTDVPKQYEQPAFTALAYATFRVGGVSLESAHALAAGAGVSLVLFGAAAAWCAYGTRTALFAGLFLATSFPLVAYGRTPVVYGTLAAAEALVFLLFVRGLESWAAWILAPAVLLGAAVGLKPTAIAAAPALVVGMTVASHRRALFLAVAIPLGLVAVGAFYELRPWVFEDTANKMMNYFDLKNASPLDVAKRLLNAPVRSGLAMEAFPLLALAWAGVLLAGARTAQREGETAVGRRLDRATDLTLATWLVGTLAFHGLFRYDPYEHVEAPLRHFMSALVPAALLAARTLGRLARGVEPALSRPAIALWAFAGAYVAMSCGWRSFFDWLGHADIPRTFRLLASFWGIAVAAAAVAAIASLTLGSLFRAGAGRTVRAGKAVLAVAIVLVLGSDAVQLAREVAYPTWSLRSANRAAAELLAPGAAVAGPWAHALTYDAPFVSRHLRELDTKAPRALLEMKAIGCTHYAIDAGRGPFVERAYRDAGEPLELLARFEIRGFPVNLYRWAWAQKLGYQLSPAEAARAAPGGPR